MNFNQLQTEIETIGNKLVHCNKKCEGIKRNQKMGFIPRYLILEERSKRMSKGCVIVGMNPGSAGQKDGLSKEQQYYKSRENLSYADQLGYWHWQGEARNYRKDPLRENKYYKHLRELTELLGLDGPILWTELVKCQNDVEAESAPTPATFNACITEYLNDEIELVPNWLIIANGQDVYNMLTCKYPERTILGVPHVTGSFGMFKPLSEPKHVKKITAQMAQRKPWSKWIRVQKDHSIKII